MINDTDGRKATISELHPNGIVIFRQHGNEPWGAGEYRIIWEGEIAEINARQAEEVREAEARGAMTLAESVCPNIFHVGECRETITGKRCTYKANKHCAFVADKFDGLDTPDVTAYADKIFNEGVEAERKRVDAELYELVKECAGDHREAIKLGLLRKELGVLRPPDDDPAF